MNQVHHQKRENHEVYAQHVLSVLTLLQNEATTSPDRHQECLFQVRSHYLYEIVKLIGEVCLIARETSIDLPIEDSTRDKKNDDKATEQKRKNDLPNQSDPEFVLNLNFANVISLESNKFNSHWFYEYLSKMFNDCIVGQHVHWDKLVETCKKVHSVSWQIANRRAVTAEIKPKYASKCESYRVFRCDEFPTEGAAICQIDLLEMPLFGMNFSTFSTRFMKSVEDECEGASLNISHYPKIIVIGQRKSGKSSVVRRLLNMNILEVGKSENISFPVEVELRRNDALKFGYRYRVRLHEWIWDQTIWDIEDFAHGTVSSERELQARISTDLNSLRQKMSQSHPHTAYIKKRVILRIESCFIPTNITFVDTPGIPDGNTGREERTIAESIVQEYILRNPYGVFICVFNSSLPKSGNLITPIILDEEKKSRTLRKYLGVLTHAEDRQSATTYRSYLDDRVITKWFAISNIQNESTLFQLEKAEHAQLIYLQSHVATEFPRCHDINENPSLFYSMTNLRIQLAHALSTQVSAFTRNVIQQLETEIKHHDLTHGVIESWTREQIADAFFSFFEKQISGMTFHEPQMLMAINEENPTIDNVQQILTKLMSSYRSVIEYTVSTELVTQLSRVQQHTHSGDSSGNNICMVTKYYKAFGEYLLKEIVVGQLIPRISYLVLNQTVALMNSLFELLTVKEVGKSDVTYLKQTLVHACRNHVHRISIRKLATQFRLVLNQSPVVDDFWQPTFVKIRSKRLALEHFQKLSSHYLHNAQ